MKISMKWAWLLTVSIACVFIGCCAPPFLFPRTGAHGIVLDQYGKPIPKVKMNVAWTPVRFFYMFAPAYNDPFEAEIDGSWRIYRRKVENMHIGPIPHEGYAYFSQDDKDSLVSLYGGQCPTNDFILRMRKIEPATNAVPAASKSEAK